MQYKYWIKKKQTRLQDSRYKLKIIYFVYDTNGKIYKSINGNYTIKIEEIKYRNA